MSALEGIITDELNEEKRNKRLLMAFSLVAGFLFNYLFYEKPLGLAYPIYVIFLLTLFRWSTRKIITVKKTVEWFGLIPILLLSGTFALYSNPVLESINFLLVPILLVIYNLLTTGQSPRVLPLTIRNLPKPFQFIAEELKPAETGNVVALKKILTGLLISIPILLVVIPLLASADMVFGHYINNLTKIGEFVNFKSIINQGIIIAFVFVYICSYIWSFYENPLRSGVPEIDLNGNNKVCKTIAWDSTIVLTVLLIINFVYLLFSVIQFSYLYGGDSHTLPAAFTHAEYARRGFFELVAVTIINLSILLSCIKFINQSNRTLYGLLRISLSLLVAFSLNMLFSAHFKMSIYEETYGLTYLRFFVHYFMGLLLLLFALAFVKIRFAKIQLIKMYIVVSIIFYTALNFINVDKVIASYNIDMYFETGRLDLHYLDDLSSDAVPEMVRLTDDKNYDIRNQAKAIIFTKYHDLSQVRPWQSFNYSRYRAHLELTKYFKESGN